MLDALGDDWHLAEAEDGKMDNNERRAQSLLAKFTSGKSVERRIIRAVFADGSSKSTNEFPELWKNEYRERKGRKTDVPIARPKNKPKFKNEDEEHDFGDCLVPSASGSEDEAPTSLKSPYDTTIRQLPASDSSSPTSFPNGSACFGGHDSLILRTRLLSLLCALSASLPTHFTTLPTLFSLISSETRPLPLPSFFSFFSPPALEPFAAEIASSLIQWMARSLLEPAAPSLQRDDDDDEINWSIFSEDYAPWAAAGQGSGGAVGENMRVGVLIEALAFLLVEEGVVLEGEEGERDGEKRSRSSIGGSQEMRDSQAEDEEGTTRGELWEAVKSGCRKRLERVRTGGKRRRKGEAAGERSFEAEKAVELAFLAGAEERLRTMLGMENEALP